MSQEVDLKLRDTIEWTNKDVFFYTATMVTARCERPGGDGATK
jgi:hypothetical protein